MTSKDELEPVLSGFRDAEASLRSLTSQIEQLQSAASALANARAGVGESATALTESATTLTELSAQLGILAAQLAGATEALIQSDPEGVKRELKNNVEQIERLRSRMDESSGEARASTHAIAKAVGQVRILASGAVLLGLAAVVLLVVFR